MNNDPVMAEVVIQIHQSGAMSIQAPMGDKKWCVAALQHAMDAIRNSSQPESKLIIPEKDVQLL